ncbi:MAG TPA: quinoprotein dehydrogenase-associated SoxYZ-like carrier [Methylibium sp.]|uniref:quinoprotein dehydrogenase-associated SoxYZ-like carrier n=1 Tax=Methylibium sp. TaxID=2067992 RepID=UPI002DB891EA|nr:quinoprotein dehydrogenase-associated SoxYZ-like carrier [Methylibium sp.]HEU4457746.1 quinoprotein dehydrogenase-associated SoxYZ-like carrier [Methylibium sp.]
MQDRRNLLARAAGRPRDAGRRKALALLGALGTLVPARHAMGAPGGLPSNTGHADASPEWDKLRAKLYGDRKVDAASGRVQLIAPLRAAYGASVPVKIVSKLAQTPELYVKRVVLLVDKNPSPIAATIELTPELGQADFETRLRVDEYSHVRVVAELSDGTLHTDARYVKTSGGCSAPPNRDALHLIGKTVFKLPEGAKPGATNLAEVTVIHPNDTGFELNNQTVMFIPPHFVRSIKVSYADKLLFDADLDFSLSENPTLRFHFVGRPGMQELRAEVEDSKEQRFVGRLPVQPGMAAAT